MKIIVSTKDLQAAIEKVMPAVPVKAQTPIQAGILFTAANDKLELQANNLNTAIKTEIPADFEGDGKFVVVGKNIAEIVAKLSGSITALETADGILKIKANATTFEVYTVDPEEFAEFHFKDPELDISIATSALQYLIKRTTFAVADEKDGRPVFQAVKFIFTPNKITAVATNTHRLAVATANVEIDLTQEQVLLIPAAALDALSKIVSDNQIILQSNDKAVMFWCGDFKMTTRLVDGNFPPHDRIIPASCATYATVNVKETAGAISRVEIISKQSEYNTVKMKFDNEGLELSAESYDAGRVVEHVNANVEGSDIEIAFNIRYVKEFLKVAGAEEARIGLNEKLSPADFRFIGEDNFIYIITPVRTN